MDENGIQILEIEGEIFSGGENGSNSEGEGDGTIGPGVSDIKSGQGTDEVIVIGGEDRGAKATSTSVVENETIDYTDILTGISENMETLNSYIKAMNDNNIVYYKTSVYGLGLIVGMLAIFLLIGRVR